jgi:hypothetical protein
MDCTRFHRKITDGAEVLFSALHIEDLFGMTRKVRQKLLDSLEEDALVEFGLSLSHGLSKNLNW